LLIALFWWLFNSQSRSSSPLIRTRHPPAWRTIHLRRHDQKKIMAVFIYLGENNLLDDSFFILFFLPFCWLWITNSSVIFFSSFNDRLCLLVDTKPVYM
jgi:hypothetical protein